MKSNEELSRESRIQIRETTACGGRAYIQLPGVTGRFSATAEVVWSSDRGWDHVVVIPRASSIMPEWRDMRFVKDIFFHDDEAVVQIHPAKEAAEGMDTDRLHLFRPQVQELPLPPLDMMLTKIMNAKKEAGAV